MPFLRGTRMITTYTCTSCNFHKPEDNEFVAIVPISVSVNMLQCCVECAHARVCVCVCVSACVPCALCACAYVYVCLH